MHIVICYGPSLFANYSQIVSKLLQTGGRQPEQFLALRSVTTLPPRTEPPSPVFRDLFSWASIGANITLLYYQCKKILDLVLLENREYVFSAAKVMA